MICSVTTETNLPPTYFAPPERASEAVLFDEINCVAHNPLVDGLMYVANGLFAVLNEQRQILALNESFLNLMGIEDASEILGLRPGEYVRCVHACDMPGGCAISMQGSASRRRKVAHDQPDHPGGIAARHG